MFHRFIVLKLETNVQPEREGPLYRVIEAVVAKFDIPYFKVTDQERVIYASVELDVLHFNLVIRFAGKL